MSQGLLQSLRTERTGGSWCEQPKIEDIQLQAAVWENDFFSNWLLAQELVHIMSRSINQDKYSQNFSLYNNLLQNRTVIIFSVFGLWTFIIHFSWKEHNITFWGEQNILGIWMFKAYQLWVIILVDVKWYFLSGKI